MILVENGPGGGPAVFGAPRALVRADTAADVPAALDALDAALASGHWVAGVASYELGYALEPRLAPLMPGGRRLPLLHFAVTGAPVAGEPALARAEAETGAISRPGPSWDAANHARAARTVLDLIRAGDIYQANLTFPFHASWTGTPLGLYGALRRRQPVPHGAVVL